MSANVTISPKRTVLLTGRRMIYGGLVFIFSLNAVLRLFANRWQGTRWGNALLSVASIPDSLYGTIRGGPYFIFELLLRWILFLIAGYVALLIIASFRFKSPTIFASGMSGFIVGLFALTWLSILILVLLLVLAVVSFVIALLHLIVAAILSFLLWPPVFYTLLGLIAVIVLVGLVSVLRGLSLSALWRMFVDWVKSLSAKPIVFLLCLLGLAVFMWFVGIPLWKYYIEPILILIRDWLVQYIVPILSWIVTLIGTLIIAIILIAAIVGILLALGWQFAEQFSSARFCGRNTHTLFEAGFAIGAVLGLVLLVCSSNPNFRSLVNTCWGETSPLFPSMDLGAAVYSLMPGKVESLLQSVFSRASIPIFDLASLLATLLLANCSLATSLVSGVTVEPLRQLLRHDRLPPLGKVLFGFFIMVAVAAASSLAGEDT